MYTTQKKKCTEEQYVKFSSSKQNLQNKRILFVLSSFNMGGSERQAVHLANHLANTQGSIVEVWAFRKPGPISEICEKYHIPWRIVHAPWRLPRNRLLSFFRILDFARTLRSYKPDVIVSYTVGPNVLCALSWRLAGAKLGIWNQRDAGLLKQYLHQKYFQYPSCFIANSEACAEFLTQECKVPNNRIEIIPNGIFLAPPKMDRSEWRKSLGFTEKDYLACMVANITGNKDHETILRAWKIVHDQKPSKAPDPILLLAGRLERVQNLKDLITDLMLENSVKFLGSVDDISGLLRSVDLAVFSSKSEGLPNGVLESLACGLPLVATDIPGIRQAVSYRQLDYLVPTGDPIEFSRAIISVIENPELSAEVSKVNSDYVCNEFSPEKLFTATVSVLGEYLEKNNIKHNSFSSYLRNSYNLLVTCLEN